MSKKNAIKKQVKAYLVPMENQMRKAFLNLKVAKSAYTEKGVEIAQQIDKAIHSNAGLNFVNPWSAHLSLKTFKQLKADGVMV